MSIMQRYISLATIFLAWTLCARSTVASACTGGKIYCSNFSTFNNYFQRGKTASAVGNWDEAVTAIQAALDTCPCQTHALLEQASAYEHLGKLPEAYSAYFDATKTEHDADTEDYIARATAGLDRLKPRVSLISLSMEGPNEDKAKFQSKLDNKDWDGSERPVSPGPHTVDITLRKEGNDAFRIGKTGHFSKDVAAGEPWLIKISTEDYEKLATSLHPTAGPEEAEAFRKGMHLLEESGPHTADTWEKAYDSFSLAWEKSQQGDLHARYNRARCTFYPGSDQQHPPTPGRLIEARDDLDAVIAETSGVAPWVVERAGRVRAAIRERIKATTGTLQIELADAKSKEPFADQKTTILVDNVPLKQLRSGEFLADKSSGVAGGLGTPIQTGVRILAALRNHPITVARPGYTTVSLTENWEQAIEGHAVRGITIKLMPSPPPDHTLHNLGGVLIAAGSVVTIGGVTFAIVEFTMFNHATSVYCKPGTSPVECSSLGTTSRQDDRARISRGIGFGIGGAVVGLAGGFPLWRGNRKDAVASGSPAVHVGLGDVSVTGEFW